MEPPILATLEERVEPGHTALVIIDMQKDFCLDGFACARAGRPLGATQALVPRLVRLRAAARRAGVLVCHVGFSTLPEHLSDSGPWLSQRRRSTYASDRICIAGTDGAEFIDELDPEAGELVIHKHRYSAFTGTPLEITLRAREIRTLVVTGVSTNVCVESTLRNAFELTYYVCVPEDGVASWDRVLHEATLKNINARFGLVTSCEALMAIWQAQPAAAEVGSER
jgi:ureidoacrylate peracid hydrolase